MARSRRRLLSTYTVGSDSVRVYRDPEWDVWVVVVAYTDMAQRPHRCECEESDRAAAEATARAEEAWLWNLHRAKAARFAPNGPSLPQEGTEASDSSGLAPSGSEASEGSLSSSSSNVSRIAATARAAVSKPQLRRFSLRREYLTGDYDSQGRYWGQGEPLYRYDSDDMVDWGHLRALSRLTAILKLRSLHPEASVRGDAVLGRAVSSRASGYGLWPLVRDQLSCPGCGSQNGIVLTGSYGYPGTGPYGRGRCGDPGSLSWAECKRCGRRGYLISRKGQE